MGPSAVDDSDTQQSTLPRKTRDSGHMIALRQKASSAANHRAPLFITNISVGNYIVLNFCIKRIENLIL